MAQSSEYKLPKRFDQNVEITGNLTVGGTVSGFTDTNYYLDGITKSGNTLTFSVNGATNQTYTFGSNAFTSYTDHSTQGYITDITTQTDSKYLRSDTSDTFTGTLTLNHSTFGAGLVLHRNDSSNAASLTFKNNSGQAGILYATYADTTLRWRDGTSTNTYEIWHEGNDGSGSGLDADTVDGIQGSEIWRKGADIGGSQNLNNYTTDGYYHQNSNANATSGSNYPVNAAGMLSVVSDGVMVYQTYHQYNGNAYYHRSYYNGTWYDWRKVWQDGNDGSGSGLDADLLDGQHGSYYQAASSAITTSNIGSQSVSNADTVDSLHASQFLRSDADDTTTGYLRVTGTSVNTTGVILGTYTGGTSLSASEVVLGSGGKTGWGVGDEFGAIRWYNTDGSGIGARDAAKILALNTQGNGTSTTTFNGELAFYTSAYNATATEKVRINDSGNLGIGTTSPSTKLHVAGGDIYTDSQVRLNQGQGITWNNGDNYIRGINGYHLQFTTYDGVSAQQEVLRLTGGSIASGGGRVGIGTTSPSAKLHISDSGADLLDLTRTSVGTYRLAISSDDRFSIYDVGASSERLSINSSGNVFVGGTTTSNLQGWGRQIASINSGSNGAALTLKDSNGEWQLASYQDTFRLTKGAVTTMKVDSSAQTRFYSSTDYSIGLTRSGNDEWWLKAYTNGTFALHENGVGDQFTILAGGNVGIGTTTPTSKLQVSGDAYVTGEFSQGVANASKIYNYGSEFRSNGASIQIAFGRDGNNIGSGAIGADSLNCFSVWNTASTVQRMVVTQAGNVGIGTASPNAILQTVGVAPTYTNGVTVFYGSTSNNLNHAGITLNSWGNALQGSIGSNLTWNNPTLTQTNTSRSSGHLKIANTTTAGNTSAFIFTGLALGTTTEVERMRIDYSGNVGIGTNSPAYPLDVTGNARITGNLYLGDIIYHNGDTNTYVRFPAADDFQIVVGGKEVFRCDEGTDPDILKLGNDRVRIYMAGGTGSTEDGTLHAKGDVYAYSTLTTSDISLKENIKPIENALDIVNKLKGVTFDWKKDGTKSLGYIAQDVEEILPEMVKEVPNWDNKETHKTVNYAAMVAILSEAIKEQQKQIEELKSIIYKS